MERLPVWSAYRRTPIGHERFGFVGAFTEEHAIEIARRPPSAPAYPVVCHKHVSVKPDFVLVDEPDEGERRSRRRAAA